MSSESFKLLRADQKVNHYPGALMLWAHRLSASLDSTFIFMTPSHLPPILTGSFQLGRKDRMWKNIAHMQARFSRAAFDFLPETFCLPGDIHLLKRAWDSAGSRGKWILKPVCRLLATVAPSPSAECLRSPADLCGSHTSSIALPFFLRRTPRRGALASR